MPSSLMFCDPLPPLADLNITADHVEKVAHQIQGVAGPGGSSALWCYYYLLQFGSCSAHIRDSVAMLTY